MAVKRLCSTVFCAGILFVSASAQPLGTGVISGTVVEAESGEAIRKAIVTLTLEGTPRRWATARTDGSGHFQFDGLPAAKYDLRAIKAEGTAIYGAKSARELGDAITLGDGESRSGITLKFFHAASIGGRVIDSDGDPVSDTQVSLLQPGRNLGAPIPVNYRAGNTDDRGEYRFSDVDPGRYYLRVTPNTNGFSGGVPASHHPILVEQYYGGARDFKDASPVHVSGGETLAGLDFHLISEPSVAIRGQVLGVPEESEPPQTEAPQVRTSNFTMRSGTFITSGGQRGPAVQVMISRADAGEPRFSSGTVAQGPEHRFEMPDMPAGRYRFEASVQSGTKFYGASEIVDLHPGSGDIALTLAPGMEIQGTLRVEGQAAHAEGPSAGRPGGIQVELRKPGAFQNNIVAQIGADGHFSFGQVFPGEWELVVPLVPHTFLKSARFGDKDVRFATFEIGANNDAALNVVVSMRTASVEGEIDAGSSEAPRAGIVVAPVGQYHTFTRFYYAAPTDADGKFHLDGIAPGKYKIFALEKTEAERFRNPEAVDQVDELGESVDLAEGATFQAHPKLIPVDRALKALQ